MRHLTTLGGKRGEGEGREGWDVTAFWRGGVVVGEGVGFLRVITVVGKMLQRKNVGT